MQRRHSSLVAFIAAAVGREMKELQLFVLNDKEEAAYFYNDLLTFYDEENVRFLPSSFRRTGNFEDKDNDSILVRTEVLNALTAKEVGMVVTYTEAMAEKVVSKKMLADMSMPVIKGNKLSITFLESLLGEYGFERNDFVYEPGQFSIRGSIVDVYSFAEERPVRIDFFGDEVESIRYFDVETQLSEQLIDKVVIVPDLSESTDKNDNVGLTEFIGKETTWWMKNSLLIHDRINSLKELDAGEFLVTSDSLFRTIEGNNVVEWGPELFFRGEVIRLEAEVQPAVNKQFDLLAEHLLDKQMDQYPVYLCSTNDMQLQRLRDIFSDKGHEVNFVPVEGTIHEGFSDAQIKVCIYTEHQIFDRYQKYRLKTSQIRKGRESITISELQNLHPGDYVVHIDHGIGRFGGLAKIDNDGKIQEAIRLVYKNNSELYVSLHSLHKISKYKGKDGEPPTVSKLGGEAWNKLKQRTKSRVKDIARELIALYAKRRREEAYAFSKDSFLQDEMEASFMYEETPDQMKAIEAVKEARAQGDLSENFEYYAAKKDKNKNESRIRYLERMIRTAKVVSDESKDDEVGLYNTVDVYFEDDDETETYKIVTTIRGNSLKGLISSESPLGRALLGHKVGDRVHVQVNDRAGYDVIIKRLEKTVDDGSDAIRSF